MKKESKRALVVGASGLIGQEVVRLLLQSPMYERVYVMVRRPLAMDHPRLRQMIVDFDTLQANEEAFEVDDVFCTLGTTIKKAGSQEAFRKVDFTYPHEVARLARHHGAEQFLIVTAMGANSQSSIFYNRVKGEVEEAIHAVQFPSLHIFRPSLLLGEREEFRRGERIAAILSPLFSPLLLGGLRKYKPIPAKVVAQSMVDKASQRMSGEHMHEWLQMISTREN